MSVRTVARALAVVLALLGGACSSGPALDLGDDFGPVADGGVAGEGGSGGSDEPDGAVSTGDGAVSDGQAGEGGDPGEPDSGPPECTSDDQCGTETPRCDDGRCVECEGEDCEEPSCEGEECEQACVIDQDCEDPERLHCSELRCVECTEDAHCTENGEPHSCDLIEGACE